MSISSFPDEIQEEILLRLPLKSILRFKSVCRTWYTNIGSPKFINNHRNLAKKYPKIMIRDAALVGNNCNDVFYSVDYASILSASTSLSLTTCECDGAVLMDNPKLKRKYGVEESRFIQILGSCNGLLCLGAASSGALILWNPSTKEYKEIMLPPVNLPWPSYGFGYDSKFDDYKLVCIVENEVYVYTLRSNTWRTVNTIACGYLESTGLHLNGALHWIGATNKTIRDIVAFDISSEKFMNLPIPDEILLLPKGSYCDLTVLGDSLCIVCGVFNDWVDIWVMQDYGVGESWTKLITTSQRSTIKPYWSLKNGEILIQNPQGFVLYDQKNDRVRFLKFSGIDGFGYLQSQSYIESLVSPNTSTCAEKRRQKRKRDPNPVY
ncbi:F-box/kelch-repeat protein At3g06240-like [Papaver somniferum]|uniref:F-box/kelch-repeat protein At3g06240-like n=1 Tax=Papaver somniferum TaxID=3469 RepID=UPI000E704841|nr:F-box/kelch-repeat protein At3g06240-like [Papaver somniferum]